MIFWLWLDTSSALDGAHDRYPPHHFAMYNTVLLIQGWAGGTEMNQAMRNNTSRLVFRFLSCPVCLVWVLGLSLVEPGSGVREQNCVPNAYNL